MYNLYASGKCRKQHFVLDFQHVMGAGLKQAMTFTWALLCDAEWKCCLSGLPGLAHLDSPCSRLPPSNVPSSLWCSIFPKVPVYESGWKLFLCTKNRCASHRPLADTLHDALPYLPFVSLKIKITQEFWNAWECPWSFRFSLPVHVFQCANNLRAILVEVQNH